VDTNSDPSQVDYPIPANDDSNKTIELIATVIADAVIEGKQIARTRAADLAAAGEREVKQEAPQVETTARRRMRQRQRGGRVAPERTPSASSPAEPSTEE
jgi:small subunit ribosomal protein S2